ncbi:inverse autotransporter beta domain-containing protein, partial [Pantoea sp.]|uniref:inverse autotransporter beta domain-containing protein n=1 Tax=Pantoea sp. TaxID=69393 RepID=UPI0039184099
MRLLPLAAALMLWLPSARAFAPEGAVPDAPFEDPARFRQMTDNLPALGYQDQSSSLSKQLATIAKSIGEASQSSSDSSFGQQAGLWAFNHFRDEVTQRVEDEGQALLSPYGTAQLDLNVDINGNFNGSGGELLTPWSDNYRYLTFSEVGLHQSDEGLLGSAGLGQRWVAGRWLLGYNAFVDR